MQKGTRLTKRIVALFLVLLLSIESFGAVVSDNDGSAFITKAEFDSLKNNFQSQIDQYNTSIDSKIDGAIASYLAGIKTASETNLPVLVNNYDEINWIKELYFYGKYKKWTTQSDYTGQLSDGWYKPSLNEKRHNLRDPSIELWDSWQLAFQFNVISMQLIINGLNYGVAFGDNRKHTESNASCPVGCIKFEKNNEGIWIPTALENMSLMGGYLVSIAHTVDALDSLYQFQLAQGHTTYYGINFETAASDQILNYTLYLRNTVSTSTYNRFKSILKTDNADWPVGWSSRDMSAEGTIAQATKCIYNTTGTTNYLYNGSTATWHTISSAYYQRILNSLLYGMFGKDNNTSANAYRLIRSTGERHICDWQGSTASGVLSTSGERISILEGGYSNYTSEGPKTMTNSLVMNLPHWPTIKLSDIASGKFMYGKEMLKMGQGLPLVSDIRENGYLKITFDTEVNDILTDTRVADDINIDIKKDDFLSSGTDWVTAYDGLVDPNQTSASTITLHNYKPTLSGTNKTVELTIPINKDEKLWMRVAPDTNDMGRYARISNLKINFVSN